MPYHLAILPVNSRDLHFSGKVLFYLLYMLERLSAEDTLTRNEFSGD